MPALADDHAQRATIAFLWALALERFRGYVDAKRGTDMTDQSSGERALDTASLRRAYADLDGVARSGGFRPPLPGEWDAEHTLAHIASADASIAAAALAIAAGQRPTYDNRVSLDESNLQRIIRQAGSLPELTDLVRRNGELLCSAAGQLSGDELNLRLPVLIVSGDEVVVDELWPLRVLIEGIGQAHLPLHADQLRGLKHSPAAPAN
jgi:hypothetical protein